MRAISFDLDDTLWAFRPCVERAESVLMEWLLAHAPATRAVLHSPTVLRDYRTQAEREHPQLHGDMKGLRLAAIRHLLRDADDDPALAEAAYEVFFAERLRVDLYADVVPALARLSARYPLVALSNGNGCIHAAGLTRFFKGALSAASLGVGKPEAAAFHAAAELAGVSPQELLHVGDDVALDVIGALNAGSQAVWLQRADADGEARRGTLSATSFATSFASSPATPAPHLTVTDLRQLCERLASFMGDA